ncbi:hypothetical protein [Actinacidiphila glaucinigra]|uniref:hypothetical protein n=1 Tax=Actinacidiphila glaucinigra TaxID=235986 RepID=UPI0037115A05
MSGLGQEPTGDTAELFGLKTRASGTGSLLRRPRPVDAPEAPQQPYAAPMPPSAPPADAPAAHDPQQDATGPAKAPVPRVVVYVSDNVSKRLERYKRHARGRTNATVLIEALAAAVRTGLADVVAQATIAPPGNDLFPAADSQLRYRGGGPIQIQANLTAPQLEVFDRLVVEAQLPDRTKLAAAALNAFLPGRAD